MSRMMSLRPPSMFRKSSRSGHRRAGGHPNRNARRIEPVEAENVDAQIVGRDALAVERIDAAHLAEEMPGGAGVEAVFGQRVFAGQQLETALVHLDHQRIPAPAD